MLKQWEEDCKYADFHNDLVGMVKSLQSFIDPRAYQATYENTVHAVKNEQIVGQSSDIAKEIKQAGDAVTRQILEEMKNGR